MQKEADLLILRHLKEVQDHQVCEEHDNSEHQKDHGVEDEVQTLQVDSAFEVIRLEDGEDHRHQDCDDQNRLNQDLAHPFYRTCILSCICFVCGR